LLDYFKLRNYIGAMDSEVQSEMFGTTTDREKWQLKAEKSNAVVQRPNTVYFARVVQPRSKNSDLGCIIKNLSSGKRSFLLFTFSDDENPQLVNEQVAPDEGYILGVSKYNLSGTDNYSVSYTPPVSYMPHAAKPVAAESVTDNSDYAASSGLSKYKDIMTDYYRDLTNDNYSAIADYYSDVLEGYIDSRPVSKYDVVESHKSYHSKYPYHVYELMDMQPYDMANNKYLTTMQLSIKKEYGDSYKNYIVKDIFRFDSNDKIIDVKVVK
jgi:hypothetical protein